MKKSVLISPIILAGVLGASNAFSAVVWNGGLWEKIGPCPYNSPADCPERDLDWKYIGPASGANTAPSTQASTQVSTTVIKSNVFTMSTPKAAQSASDSTDGSSTTTNTRASLAGADLFINNWELAGNKGRTYGLNPSYSIGDKHALTLTLPLYLSDPEDGDGYKTVGLDGLYKLKMSDTIAFGGHINYLYVIGDGDIDNSSSVTAGPFASYLYQMSEKVGVSFGLLLDITSPDEGDTITQLVPGVNIGYNLNDFIAINGFFMGYYQLNADDGVDDTFADIGAEVAYSNGNWSLNLGIKKTVALDIYDSVEFYLGSEWRF